MLIVGLKDAGDATQTKSRSAIICRRTYGDLPGQRLFSQLSQHLITSGETVVEYPLLVSSENRFESYEKQQTFTKLWMQVLAP